MTGTLPLQFPILSFMPDYGPWATGGEDLEWFADEDDFTRIDRRTLMSRPHLHMLLVDAASRNWRVVGMQDLGGWGGPLMRLLRAIDGVRRVAYTLEEQPPMTFAEVQERVCASIDTHADRWRDDEAIAGESGPPRNEQDMLDERCDRVRAAGDLQALIKALEGE